MLSMRSAIDPHNNIAQHQLAVLVTVGALRSAHSTVCSARKSQPLGCIAICLIADRLPTNKHTPPSPCLGVAH